MQKPPGAPSRCRRRDRRRPWPIRVANTRSQALHTAALDRDREPSPGFRFGCGSRQRRQRFSDPAQAGTIESVEPLLRYASFISGSVKPSATTTIGARPRFFTLVTQAQIWSRLSRCWG